PAADVRAWTIRFLGDPPRPPLTQAGRSGLSSTMVASLIEIARTEKIPSVRSQLASTCKRLPGTNSLPIVHELLRHQEDVDDPHIPLLLWWAIEDKAISDRDRILDCFRESEAWQTPLIHRFMVERLARRYMAEGGQGYAACARMLTLAPDAGGTTLVAQGMEKALEGKQLSSMPKELNEPLQQLWSERPTPLLVRLELRLGSGVAYQRALQMILDPKEKDQDRASVIDTIGQVGNPSSVPALEKVLSDSKSNVLRLAALSALE